MISKVASMDLQYSRHRFFDTVFCYYCFLLFLVQKYQVQVQSSSGCFDTQISAILAHDSHWEAETSTLTVNHEVVLRLDEGDPDPLRTVYIMLTFTDIILHSRITKIIVLRHVMRHWVFLTFFRANGV